MASDCESEEETVVAQRLDKAHIPAPPWINTPKDAFVSSSTTKTTTTQSHWPTINPWSVPPSAPSSSKLPSPFAPPPKVAYYPYYAVGPTPYYAAASTLPPHLPPTAKLPGAYPYFPFETGTYYVKPPPNAKHVDHPDCPNNLNCLPDDDNKPTVTLATIARCAILGSPMKRLTLAQIYAAIEAKYPFLRTQDSWRVRSQYGYCRLILLIYSYLRRDQCGTRFH